ncbi:MAG: 16S rRNA (cytidine(1402)-2'-O)-methyltransferase [Anaerolineae bacterium]|nr:16S rRNA (cytidine(1402)-2'-O)-methyltransferase [Anaerolineae bacterium]
MNQKGCLYIIATPIGNPEDITLRALKTLREVNAVICEEKRQGAKTLSQLGIKDKEIITLNEHNEQTQTPEIILRLLNGQTMGLISDCGTPVFADPGSYLINQAVHSGIPITALPGASSLMAALSVLDTPLDKFVFGGFLPRENEARFSELKRLKAMHMPVILMDTPYRMAKLLTEVAKVFGKSQHITLACDLTLPEERVYRGCVAEVQAKVGQRKAEFILIVH